MGRIRSIVAGVGIVGASVVAVPGGPSVEAQAAPHVIVTPSAAAPGSPITVSGYLECPDMAPGGAILISVEYVDDDQYVRTNLSPNPPLGPDNTFELVTTVPTSMWSIIDAATVPTPPGQHRIAAFCTQSSGDDDSVQGSYTVLAGGPPATTTTTTPPSTTTTVASTTTSATSTTIATATTVPPGATTTTTVAPGFAAPSAPPAMADAFVNRPDGPVQAGDEIVVDEDGFIPGETVHVVLYSTPQVLASVTADDEGTVRSEVVIPSATPPGEHTLVLYGGNSVKAMALDVVAPAGGPGGGAPGSATGAPRSGATSNAGGTGAQELPRTGSGTGILLLAGMGLTGLGVVVLHVRRGLVTDRR